MHTLQAKNTRLVQVKSTIPQPVERKGARAPQSPHVMSVSGSGIDAGVR